jgi:hypothetical protein
MPTTEHPNPDQSATEPSPRSGSRKLLGAAAFSLALAGGGVAGAVLGTPSTSLAQDDTTETTEATDAEGTETPPPGPPGGRFEHRGEGLTAAAEALGVTEEELRTALQDGQSIAQVAEAEGVELQTVIDALVANGTERLEEAIAELPDRMAELVEREGLGDRGGRFPGRGHGPGPMGGLADDGGDGTTTDDGS